MGRSFLSEQLAHTRDHAGACAGGCGALLPTCSIVAFFLLVYATRPTSLNGFEDRSCSGKGKGGTRGLGSVTPRVVRV